MQSFDSLVPPPPSRRTGLPWWGILLIVIAILVPACGLLGTLGVYGVRRYVLKAKQDEALQALPVFARAVIECADAHGDREDDKQELAGRSFALAPGDFRCG